VTIQPTECDEYGCRAIDDMSEREGVRVQERKEGEGGVRRANRLDVLDKGDWERLSESLGGAEERYDLVVGSNFLHMIPCSSFFSSTFSFPPPTFPFSVPFLPPAQSPPVRTPSSLASFRSRRKRARSSFTVLL
jgi:hypothetical protein